MKTEPLSSTDTRLGLLLEALDRLLHAAEAILLAEDRDVGVHGLGHLVADLGDPAPGAVARDDLVDHLLLAAQLLAGGRGHAHALGHLGGVGAGAAAEDQGVQQRVGAQAVAAVHRHAGALAGGVEAGHLGLAVHVGLDAAHHVVVAGLDVDGLLGDVRAREVAAHVHDLAQRLVDALGADHGDVQRHGAVGEAATLVDLGLLGARDHVARGQLHLVGRVLLHEALALGVVEVGALAAGALGDQQPDPGQRGGVVLDHLHVHQRCARVVGHGDPVAGTDERVGGGVEDLAVAARGQDHGLGGEQLEGAVADVAGHRAGDPAGVVADQGGGEPLLVAVHLLVPHQLLVEHVQQRLAGDVGDVVGAGRRGAAEGAGAELALLVAVEGHAPVLELQHLVGSLPAHDLDGVLVAQVVRALDRVEGVRLPGVLGVQRGVDAARRRVGVRADRMDLADDADGCAALCCAEGGSLSGEAGSYDEDVVLGHWVRG